MIIFVFSAQFCVMKINHIKTKKVEVCEPPNVHYIYIPTTYACVNFIFYIFIFSV